jgi:hypothetical protein
VLDRHLDGRDRKAAQYWSGTEHQQQIASKSRLALGSQLTVLRDSTYILLVPLSRADYCRDYFLPLSKQRPITQLCDDANGKP